MIYDPCPFCGFYECKLSSSGSDVIFVECSECGASGPAGNTEKEAIMNWEKRS